jgi:hypothetical protein
MYKIDKLIESFHEFNLEEDERVGKMCKLGIHKSLFVTCFIIMWDFAN